MTLTSSFHGALSRNYDVYLNGYKQGDANMSSAGKKMFFFLTISSMLCSVTCVSRPYVTHRGDSQSLQSASDRVIHKRALRVSDASGQPETVVCNNLEGQRTWTCTCSGCDDASSPPCCVRSANRATLNQSVAIVISNMTYDDINDVTEADLKQSLSEAISKFCRTTTGSECASLYRDTDISPINRSASPLIPADHVVFIELEQVGEQFEAGLSPMSIRFVVLRRDNVSIPGQLIVGALSVEREALGQTLGRDVLAVRALPWPDDAADQSELPVKAIIAGSVLGFFLALSCIISAVKAVRDRRLIKERNLAKRERRRQKELRDSIRRSPLKQKLEEYAGKSQPESTASNGDVRTPSTSSHMVHVVVHTSNESLNGGLSPNGKPSPIRSLSPNGRLSPPNGEAFFSEEAPSYDDVVTQGEVHSPPTGIKTDNVSNASSTTDARNSPAEGRASNDLLQGSAQENTEDTNVPPVGEFRNKSTTSLHSIVDAEASVTDPRPMENDVSEASPGENRSPGGLPVGRISRPGLVNPAYDGE